LAEICSRATVDDPLNVIFQQDKTGSSTHVTTELLYPAARARIETKVKAGASVVEAANFAAVVCWEPPEATTAHPDLSETELEEIGRARPVFASFVRQMQEVRIRTLGRGQAYWNMSLMARDPDRKDKGVVRAVIEPYVERAKREGVPIWLCAANERARDVYEYFGFRTVGITWSYLDVEKEEGEGGGQQMGVPTWCMVCNWPVDKTKFVVMERNGMLEC
jgi:ribosomal protein S18 acetylase RimI-like enzyme